MTKTSFEFVERSTSLTTSLEEAVARVRGRWRNFVRIKQPKCEETVAF